MDKKDIIKKLQTDIDDCVHQDQSMDEASWGYETGVLITPRIATEIVKVLSATCKWTMREGSDIWGHPACSEVDLYEQVYSTHVYCKFCGRKIERIQP